MFTWDEILANAIVFAKKWKDAHNEEAQAQSFELDFLRVFGVDEPDIVGDFEYKVPLSGGHTGYIDYLWKKQIAIEMKSKGKDLSAAYAQLQNYLQHLPPEEIPDLWLVCDFENMRLTRRSTSEVWNFKTKDLRKHIRKFAGIAGYATERLQDDQVEVNVKAAEKMAKLHDALKLHGYEGHELEVYLVRLLFCMFADDTGIFPQGSFSAYVEASQPDGSDLSHRISDLFEILNMPGEVREKKTLLSEELRRFRYINGGLFAERLASADFDAKMRRTLLDCANFDWNAISPAIFGAMFQGVMNPAQRRETGAHYTSEENILKLINPLFLDELWREFDRVKTDPTALERFHGKLANLKFLDPACGCGNFLIITYRELRRLELEVLKMQYPARQMVIDITPMLSVGVEQFFGIEYEGFPCQIAQVGMWLTDHQMNLRASEQFGTYYARLPLTQSATIVHGNALRIDWERVIPKQELSYILGNPPFVGYSYQTPEQKEDIATLYKAKNLDYCCCWYYKAVQYIQGTGIHCALVSTNSITQGEQTAGLWKPLYDMGAHINFGIPTFKWSNEAKGKAAVHCVIIGVSLQETQQDVNPYLIKAPVVFIESRNKPLCDVPSMSMGNKPVDGGNYLFGEEEKNMFIQSEPNAAKYFKKWIGADEFINGYSRYCLLLKDCSPGELRKMPHCLARVEAVRNLRQASKKVATQRLAESPIRFECENFPTGNYIIVPEVSSERRRYIPIGFMPPEVVASNLVRIIPGADLYHFGVLTSNVHMAWVRAVCGRLKSDYRYSKDIVYNNFPWPNVTDEQHAAIEQTARGILDARALFPNSSLADLYDPLTMPPELRKAHQANDRAVMKAYGFTAQNTPNEAACVAKLMERYQELTVEASAKQI